MTTETNTTHTPGPWEVIANGVDRPTVLCIRRNWTSGEYIACIHHTGGPITEEDKSNALLLATAPELLEALRCLHDVQNGPPLIKYEKEWQEAMRQAVAAIAKAEGRP